MAMGRQRCMVNIAIRTQKYKFQFVDKHKNSLTINDATDSQAIFMP